MRRAAVGAVSAVIAVGSLTACSPTDIHYWVYGNGTGFHVDAKAGPDDGGGSHMRAEIRCSNEVPWRRDAGVDTNREPNGPGGTYVSEITCPWGQYIVGINVFRW